MKYLSFVVIKFLFVPIVVLGLLTYSNPLYSQVRSIKSGDWHDASVWNTKKVPRLGSAVVIQHPITITRSVKVITSHRRTVRIPRAKSAMPRLTVVGGGVLQIAAGSTLEVDGSVLLDNAQLIMNEGSSLLFKLPRKKAGTYSLTIGGVSGTKNAQLIARGTAAAPVKIAKRGGRKGVVFISDGQQYGGGNISASFLTIENLGSGTLPAISSSTPDGYVFSLSDTRLVRSGAIKSVSQLGVTATFLLDRVSFAESLGSYNLEVQGYNNLQSGTRTLRSCFFDALVRLYSPNDFIVNDSIFVQGYEVTEGKWQDFRRNLVMQEGKALRSAGDIYDSYWLIDNAAETNPHFIQSSYYSFDEIFSGNIFEATGPGADGDAILIGESQKPVTITIEKNIVLPNGSNNTSGTPFSAQGNSNTAIYFDHNTFIAGIQSAAVGETYQGYAGMLKSFRSNIAWDSQVRGYLLADSGSNDAVIDLVPESALSNNAIFNILPGSNGFGLNNLEFSSNIQQLPFQIEPQFVDATRDISSWALSVGATDGSVKAALLALQEGVHEGSSVKSVASLVDFVKKGFRPQNSALINAGHDGKTVGAVE